MIELLKKREEYKINSKGNLYKEIFLLTCALVALGTFLFFLGFTSFQFSINFRTVYVTLLFFTILFLILFQRFNSSIFYYNKDGIRILDMWFRYKKIPWDKIVSFEFLRFRNNAGEEINGILIEFDVKWTRLVNTGLKTPAIALTEKEYDLRNYKSIENRVGKFRRENLAEKDTLNERLRKQVSSAWETRYRRMILETMAKSEIFFIPVLVLELVSFTLLLTPPFVLLIALLFTIISYFLLVEFTNLPYSIVGIRGSELGAVLYNPDELLSNIRFVFMVFPFSAELITAEMIYEENTVTQISNFIQIHPKVITPGILTHGNAQISGNHTLSIGITIVFKLNQEEFKIPVFWKDQ